MPIKATIVSGPNFCLYRDEGEFFSEEPPQAVVLKLHDCEFEASSPGHVSVRIPMAAWEFMRRYPAMNFELATKSDVELAEEAEHIVEQNIEWEKDAKGLARALRFDADMPKAERTAKYLAQMKRERDFQQRVLALVKEYEGENPPRE